mmetsp:Transcript_33710/g.53600  ORF Transcript_33710/g.53600 Transcript_33710/m.53600 type:complete len:272 (-) Transcript_33710:41-856(-)
MAFIFAYRPEDGAKWRREKQARKEAAEKALAASAPTLPAVDAELPSATGARVDEGGHKPRQRAHSSSVLERPLSASTHLRQMREQVHQKLEVQPVSIEHHRKLYYPRVRYGLVRRIGDLPPGIEAPPSLDKHGIPLPERPRKKYGSLISDYGKAGDQVEKQWIQRRLEGTLNDPIPGKAKTRIEGIPGRLSASVDSPQATTCMVGGTTICLRAVSRIPKDMRRDDQRQLGLYEDSFRFWRGDYVAPEYGLGTTDVTSFAGEYVAQKALARK